MLDLFFRKYGWTANLVLLFAASWLSAKTVNTFVGAVIRPNPQVDLAPPPAEQPRPTLPTPLDMEALYHLIGQEPPRAPEDGPAAPQAPRNCEDPRAAPVKSAARMQLVAGVLAERARFSLATVADLNTRETHVLGVGDEVSGVRLMALDRIRDDRDATGNGFKVVAIVCNAGTKEYLDFEPVTAGVPDVSGPNLGWAPVPPRPPMPGGFAPPAPPGGQLAGVRKINENSYDIDRAVVDATLSDLNKLAMQARMVPSFKNGVANGFKIFSIQPGSLFAAMGIQNGDVIQRVNGYEINSPDKALELLQKMKETPRVNFDGECSGQPCTKTYNVR